MCFAHGKVLPPHSINPSYALVKCCRAELSLGGGSYALCRCVRHSCIYTGCMSYFECSNAITNKTNSLTLLCACIYMWVISLVSTTYDQLVLSLPYMGSNYPVLARIPANRTRYVVPLSNIVKLTLLAAASFTGCVVLLLMSPTISYSIVQDWIAAVMSESTVGA